MLFRSEAVQKGDSAAVKQAIAEGILSRADVRKQHLKDHRHLTAFAETFQRLRLEDAEKVLEKATPDERDAVRLEMLHKRRNAIKAGRRAP